LYTGTNTRYASMNTNSVSEQHAMELFHTDTDYCTLILGCSSWTRSPMLGTMRAGTLSSSAVKLFFERDSDSTGFAPGSRRGTSVTHIPNLLTPGDATARHHRSKTNRGDKCQISPCYAVGQIYPGASISNPYTYIVGACLRPVKNGGGFLMR